MFVLSLSLFVCFFQFGLKIGKKYSWKFWSEMSDVQLETINKWSQYSSLYLKKKFLQWKKEKGSQCWLNSLSILRRREALVVSSGTLFHSISFRKGLALRLVSDGFETEFNNIPFFQATKLQFFKISSRRSFPWNS